jgi:hypothetical protein
MNMLALLRARQRAERINASILKLEKMTPLNRVRVRTDERRAYMLAHTSDLVFYNGCGYRVCWKNLQGGVWEAYLCVDK